MLTGVTSRFDLDGAESKQALLLFDRIATSFPSVAMPRREPAGKPSAEMTAYDSLISSGAVAYIDGSEIRPTSSYFLRLDIPAPWLLSPSKDVLDREHDDAAIRIAKHIRPASNERVVPLLRSASSLAVAGGAAAVLLHVVLKELPLPSADTSWAAIMEWRNDETARQQYRRLLAWISRSAASGMDTVDAYDQFASMIDDYAAYMSSKHQTFTRTSIGVFITTTAEIIESVASFKLSTAVKSLCELFTKRVDIPLDFGAPGREVAFIVSARKRFAP
jgi:hypothetical protein